MEYARRTPATLARIHAARAPHRQMSTRLSKPQQLTIVSEGKELVLEAESAPDVQEWQRAIELALTAMRA